MEPARKKESFATAAPKNTPPASKTTKETFTYFAPNAQNVALVGNFTGWEKNPVPLKKQKDGSWRGAVSLAPGEYQYRFLVDGQWQDDEQCEERRPNGFGQQNCIRQVA